MSGNDHWTLDLKALGMQPAGDELARRVLTCRPPYALCVQGKWGSGKTSLMRYAMAKLGGEPLAVTLATQTKPTRELPKEIQQDWDELYEESAGFLIEQLASRLTSKIAKDELDPRVVPIWFNPWQHQQTEQPVVGLLQELQEQFTGLLKHRKEFADALQTSVEAALPLLDTLANALGALQGLPPVSGLSGYVENWRESKKRRDERNFRAIPDAQRLNLLFEEAVRRLLGANEKNTFVTGKGGELVVQRRLVIFIDDLDRCGEQQTVHLLEAIKLYLQTPYCVFVLGMDGAAARRAVEGVLGQGQEVAREYLEKLFQSTLHVPLPVQPEAFIVGLLKATGLTRSTTGLTYRELARRIEELVEPNPRKLKTFVSGLSAGWAIEGKSSEDFGFYLLLTYLRTVHPDVYRLLAYEPSYVGNLHEILADGSLPNTPTPVDYFLHRALRHAFDHLQGLKELPERPDTDLVVDELIERLDHLRGDRAFREQWTDEVFGTGEITAEIVQARATRLLRLGPPLLEEKT
ncbi:MAG: P-loop NTPase fold protein [Acidobacteriota bacterium]|nr:P-loop NTPase fold protein [Acidobacteriota bacterium]